MPTATVRHTELFVSECRPQQLIIDNFITKAWFFHHPVPERTRDPPPLRSTPPRPLRVSSYSIVYVSQLAVYASTIYTITIWPVALVLMCLCVSRHLVYYVFTVLAFSHCPFGVVVVRGDKSQPHKILRFCAYIIHTGMYYLKLYYAFCCCMAYAVHPFTVRFYTSHNVVYHIFFIIY